MGDYDVEREREAFEAWARGTNRDVSTVELPNVRMYARGLTRQLWFAWMAAVKNRPPIDMVLLCPECGAQHIDVPKACDMGVGCTEAGSCYAAAHGEPNLCRHWTNPPHRSHPCAVCAHIWRPADVPTNGVAAIKTKGKNDSPISIRRYHP